MSLVHRQFLSYPHHDLPAIPVGWVDDSWHNDHCPSWIVGEYRDDLVKVYIDWPEVEARLSPSAMRYSVVLDYNSGDGVWEEFETFAEVRDYLKQFDITPYYP
jgi:hypothetical protein